MMLRLALTIAAIATITAALIPAQWLSVALRLPTRRTIPVLYHRMICTLLGIRIVSVGRRTGHSPVLVVANHCSWIDISVITAVAPVVFVAKLEVASWPLFGLLAKLQRTVFVDRTRRHKTDEVNAEIGRRLADGDPVVLFAEGTSSDGNRVLPFRSALIGAVEEALAQARHVDRVFIQPLSIAYTRLHGLPLGRQHRPVVAWYGHLDLVPHLCRVIQHGAVDVVVTWGEPIGYDGQADRKAIARSLEATVRRLTIAALRGDPAPGASGPADIPNHSILPEKPLIEARNGGDDRHDGVAEHRNVSNRAVGPTGPDRTQPDRYERTP